MLKLSKIARLKTSSVFPEVLDYCKWHRAGRGGPDDPCREAGARALRRLSQPRAGDHRVLDSRPTIARGRPLVVHAKARTIGGVGFIRAPWWHQD